jgi:hypothetical protein
MVFIRPVEGKKFDAVVRNMLSYSCQTLVQSVQFSADHPDTLLYVHVPVGEEAHQAGGRLHRSHAPELVCYRRGGASLCIGGSATDHSKKTRRPDREQPTVRTEPPALIGPLTTEETITWKNLNTKRMRFAAASNLEQEAEALAVLTRPTIHALVKKDRFGPEVEEVTLQMPPLFPKFSGDLCRHTHIHTYHIRI